MLEIRDLERELLEEVQRGAVVDRVHRVQAEAVEMVVAEPHAGVVAEEAAHLVALGAVEVHGRAPRRRVAARQVWAEAREEVPRGPEVVVDHVENGGEPPPMACIDESLETRRAAVRVVRRVEIDAVVAPAALSRELLDRHQLDVSHPELDEMVEALARRVEGPARRERPDVELVEDGVPEGARLPACVRPREGIVIDDLGRSVDAARLRRRPRIR